MKMPGMLYGDMVRCPYAHARIKKIDKPRKAQALPGVRGGADRRRPGAAQAALDADARGRCADGAGRREGAASRTRKIAFVVADDRYVAADAAELVEVEYEELPALVDPFKALAADAPVLREDLAGKTAGRARRAQAPQPHLHWQSATARRPTCAFDNAEVTVKELISYQRVHPCAAGDLPCVASFDKVQGRADAVGHVPGAARGAHGGGDPVGHSRASRSTLSRPTSAAASATRSASIRAMSASVVASIVTGKPVKWVEDRIENLSAHLLRARLPHDRRDSRRPRRQNHGAARARAGRSRRVRRLRRSVQMAGRLVQHRDRAPTISPPRIAWWTASTPTRRRAASPIAARSASPRRPICIERGDGHPGATSSAWTRPSCD